MKYHELGSVAMQILEGKLVKPHNSYVDGSILAHGQVRQQPISRIDG